MKVVLTPLGVILFFEIHPIGTLRTPFDSSKGVPIQSSHSDAFGEILLHEDLTPALESLDGFSHIILLYWFHKTKPAEMKVRPYLDDREHGLFSTRTPMRPNPIGLSIVEIIRIEKNRISFKGADMLDGSPLIDIKPFVPIFDNRLNASSGWLEKSLKDEDRRFVSDERFQK